AAAVVVVDQLQDGAGLLHARARIVNGLVVRPSSATKLFPGLPELLLRKTLEAIGRRFVGPQLECHLGCLVDHRPRSVFIGVSTGLRVTTALTAWARRTMRLRGGSQ